MFGFLARQTYRQRWLFVALGAIVLGIGIVYGSGVFSSLKGGGLSDPASESAREAQSSDRAFPDARVSLILLMRSPSLTTDQPAYQAEAKRLLQTVKADPATQSVTSYFDTQDDQFVSRDKHETYAVIGLNGTEDEQTAAYQRLRKKLTSSQFDLTYGGPVAAGYETNQQVQHDIPRAEMISTPILAILLVLIFRSVIATMLPLLIGAISVLGAFALTRLLATHIDISVFAVNIMSLLGLGLAIDYSLLFVSRFRGELMAGKSVPGALDTTVRTAGESVLFSGTTVALSLLGLLAFPENFLRSMGIGGALAVIMAMLASLTVLPALLGILGPWVNRAAIPIPHMNRIARSDDAGFWRAFSRFVIRWTAVIVPVTLIGLIASGLPFFHARFANPGADSLPETFQTRLANDAMTNDFAASPSPPINLLLTLPAPALASKQLTALSEYVARLKTVPGVTSVESLVSIDPRIPSDQYGTFYSMDIPAAKFAKARFASGNQTLISVEYRGDSQSPQAQRLVAALRNLPPPSGARALVGGETAELVDHLASIRAHLPVAGAIVMAATLALLFLMLSSIVIPLTALILNTLSLVASFGLMTWIFQDGHLENFLAFTSNGSIDATIPVLIFTMAFGLATDYEVFLVSRIKEEYDRTGDTTEAIAFGVEKTGGIITSAALLLVVVVAAFGMGHILSMKEMGVGLALSVIVDAAIVRTLLVPTTMQLFGRANWWLPGKAMPPKPIPEKN